MTLSSNLKFIISIAIGVAAVVVPVYLWQSEPSRSVSVQLTSSVAIQADIGQSIDDMEIFFSGEKVESPYLSTLEVINDGARPIASSDFETPIQVSVQKDAAIVQTQIEATHPQDLPRTLELAGASAVIHPLLLNPGDSISISLITSGNAPEFVVRGRIAGVAAIAFNPRINSEMDVKRAAIHGTLALISGILYVLFSSALLRPNWFRLNRLIIIAVMLVLAVASGNLARGASEAAGVELTNWAATVFLATCIILGVPLVVRMARSRNALRQK